MIASRWGRISIFEGCGPWWVPYLSVYEQHNYIQQEEKVDLERVKENGVGKKWSKYIVKNSQRKKNIKLRIKGNSKNPSLSVLGD